jgi:hypothetical protein
MFLTILIIPFSILSSTVPLLFLLLLPWGILVLLFSSLYLKYNELIDMCEKILKNSIVLYEDHFIIKSKPIISNMPGKMKRHRIPYKNIHSFTKCIDAMDDESKMDMLEQPYNEEGSFYYKGNSVFSNQSMLNHKFKKYFFGRFANRDIDPNNVYILQLRKPQFFSFYEPIDPEEVPLRKIPRISGKTSKLLIEIPDMKKLRNAYSSWKKDHTK